jgi:hypothetical protein
MQVGKSSMQGVDMDNQADANQVILDPGMVAKPPRSARLRTSLICLGIAALVTIGYAMLINRVGGRNDFSELAWAVLFIYIAFPLLTFCLNLFITATRGFFYVAMPFVIAFICMLGIFPLNELGSLDVKHLLDFCGGLLIFSATGILGLLVGLLVRYLTERRERKQAMY